jgi:hypothetical protein
MSQIIQQQTPLPNVHIDISDVSMWRQALNTTNPARPEAMTDGMLMT